MAKSIRKSSGKKAAPRKIRYAVVGLGHIAQAAVLPAFANAKKNSELTALVSDDPLKLKKLGRKYGVTHHYDYTRYDECLRSGEIDAVYIALPNHLHAEYSIQAARAGVHVLCEKPMAINEEECSKVIAAADEGGVKLMIAYRLHFEEANLKAIELLKSRKLGEIRLFDSVFSMQVKPGNIRLELEMGGGPLYDLGVYCINAARYLFRDEPLEVFAYAVMGRDRRFAEVEEMLTAVMRFPEDRLAQFTCSFGAADVSAYSIVGTKGSLRVDPAYEYAGELKHHLTLNGKTRTRVFKKRDQFAPELLYFSNCILSGTRPEPSGNEGLIDVRIINALYQSARTGQPIPLGDLPPDRNPSIRQEQHRPAVSKQELVHAESASQ